MDIIFAPFLFVMAVMAFISMFVGSASPFWLAYVGLGVWTLSRAVRGPALPLMLWGASLLPVVLVTSAIG